MITGPRTRAVGVHLRWGPGGDRARGWRAGERPRTKRSERVRNACSWERSKVPPVMGASRLATPWAARLVRSSGSEWKGRCPARWVQATGTSEHVTPEAKGQVTSS